MSCWKPWPTASVPGCTPTRTIPAAGRRIFAKLRQLPQSIKLIPYRDCRTEAVAKARKIERSLGSSFIVSVSDRGCISESPDWPRRPCEFFDAQQDVEAAAFSYTHLHGTPAASFESPSFKKRATSDIESPSLKSKESGAKKRK